MIYFFNFLIFCMVMLSGNVVKADQPAPTGISYYLNGISPDCMEKYRKEFNRYASSIKAMESVCPDDDVIDGMNYYDFVKKDGYTYKVVQSSEDHYHIISLNDKGMPNYEITDEMKYYRMIFADEKHREQEKERLFQLFADATMEDKGTIAFDFANFPDKDVKIFLLDIIKNPDLNEDIKICAFSTLGYIVEKSDTYVLKDLMDIWDTQTFKSSIIYSEIIKMLKILKDPKSIKYLKMISSYNFQHGDYDLKQRALEVIKEIEQEMTAESIK